MKNAEISPTHSLFLGVHGFSAFTHACPSARNVLHSTFSLQKSFSFLQGQLRHFLALTISPQSEN